MNKDLWVRLNKVNSSRRFGSTDEFRNSIAAWLGLKTDYVEFEWDYSWEIIEVKYTRNSEGLFGWMSMTEQQIGEYLDWLEKS